MGLTTREVDEFRDFAVTLIEDGHVDSLTDCIQQWKRHCDHRQDIESIRDAQADVAAGRTKPADQVEGEILAEYDLASRQSAS